MNNIGNNRNGLNLALFTVEFNMCLFFPEEEEGINNSRFTEKSNEEIMPIGGNAACCNGCITLAGRYSNL
jgi:hypothetical protein